MTSATMSPWFLTQRHQGILNMMLKNVLNKGFCMFQIIKQCQVILNFLAAEGRLSTQHIDCIWAAAQLKHCSRYIHDLFPSLIKNLDPVPLRHLLNLVSGLHPSAHTEQTFLFLFFTLRKSMKGATDPFEGADLPRNINRRARRVYSPYPFLRRCATKRAYYSALNACDRKCAKEPPAANEPAVTSPPEWALSLSQSIASLTKAIEFFQDPTRSRTTNPPIQEASPTAAESPGAALILSTIAI
ncbi:unnamed protein product [Ranitomeya imitator]|uniref:Uncharacterized protein n=1 Tax=Ranitomeya imitator TaxID=111125 RepID=A0ABN9L560_9NEOB|nr:unnamed protein product [Ranitomeya imitator]